MDSKQEKEVEPGKVFVGGLSWETTKENLLNYFSQYGDVTDAVIMVDAQTAKPRGFGFVTFKDPSLVESVCRLSHELDTKKIDPKPATSRSSSSNYTGRVRKIFIGGVGQNTTDEDIRMYFTKFGNVTDVELKYDKATQRMKGFGFVGFDCEEVVDRLTQGHRFHTIKEKSVEVKKAEPRTASSASMIQQQQHQQQQQLFAAAMGGQRGFPSQSFSTGAYTTAAQQNYYNSNYQQQGFGNFPVGYNSGYGQPSYGAQQPATYSQQQAYAQPQSYGYDAYNTASRQGQDQVASYGQDQGATYTTNRNAYVGATADQYGQGTAAAGYNYTGPTAPYTPPNYQDQSTVTAAYSRGQAPQRSQFPPYGGR